MKRSTLFGVLLCLGVTPLSAQYGKYEWAMGLHRDFGFDDMAEKILSAMVSGAGHSDTEKIQGQLGLAELRADLARTKSGTERVELLGAAAQLMKAAVGAWPEKDQMAYYDAIFSLVGVLQEQGDGALEATVAADQQEKLKQVAIGAYGEAQKFLETNIRSKFENADLETERDKWRLKNRAWYQRCFLLYSEAQAHKKGGQAYTLKLSQAHDELENFILANDIADDEAWVGAMYGTILQGQVFASRDDDKQALSYLTSVIDQINEFVGWERKMAPSIQAMAERGFYALLKHLNDRRELTKTMEYGAVMEANYKKATMTFKTVGRAARVELAKAYFRTGETNPALAIAAQVAENGKTDASGVLANRLIAEIIAATPDKSQFAPEIIKSAADGAWSQGRGGWSEGVRYYRILLDTLGQIADVTERSFVEADAWFKIGYYAYDRERWLEAALAFEQGTRRCKDVDRDGMASKLADYWRRSLRRAVDTSGSKGVDALMNECLDFLANVQLGTKSPQEIAWEKGQREESEAKKLEREKQLAPARARWEAAAAAFAECAGSEGRFKERAMARQARCVLRQARLFEDEKNLEMARKLLLASKLANAEYVAFTQSPANALSDPQLLAAREAALAEAKYAIADANTTLIGLTAGDPEKNQLREESVSILTDFESTYASQTSLVIFAVYRRLECRLDLGRFAEVRADYDVLKALDPNHRFTALGGAKLASQLKGNADKLWDGVVGSKFVAGFATAEETRVAKSKPGFDEARAAVLEACDLYRDWLFTSSDAQAKSGNWVAVGWYYFVIGAWEPSADVHRKALARFAGKLSADEAEKLQVRLLVATHHLVREAEEGERTAEAAGLWSECEQLVELLLTGGKKRNTQLERIAAEVYGGYVRRNSAGFYTQVVTRGQHGKAADLWRGLYQQAERTDPGGPESWDARFHLYYNAVLDRKQKNQTVKDLATEFQRMRTVNPELGGPNWKPLFEWMESKLLR